MRQLATYGGGTLAVTGLIVGLVMLISAGKTLPPTSFAGHAESYPDRRVSTSTPISLSVQRHIIEHIPGPGERPGVLLEFNCEEFECAPDLVEKLASVARQYAYVYMAPFPQMDAKIALAARNALLTLDAYDEQRIVEFIEGH